MDASGAKRLHLSLTLCCLLWMGRIEAAGSSEAPELFLGQCERLVVPIGRLRLQRILSSAPTPWLCQDSWERQLEVTNANVESCG